MAFPKALKVFGKFAGKALANQAGLEFGGGFRLTPELRAEAVQIVAEGMYLAMKQLAEEEAESATS